MYRFHLSCVLSLLCALFIALPAEAVPVTGACCTNTLECIDNESLESCQALGNGFAGVGSSCSTNALCNNLVGACCSTDSCTFGKWTQCLGSDQTFAGANTSCDDPGVCADPAPRGACCYSDGCAFQTEEQCNGTWQGEDTSCTDELICVDTGACCHAGGCTQTSAASCSGDGYHFAGLGTSCVTGSAAPQCPDQVACCVDGTCADTPPEVCESSGGVDVGSCDDPSPECVAPTGACCTATGCNENVLEDICVRASNNTWGGVGSTCDDVGFCEENELGACCHSDGCIEQSETQCSGTWQGTGTSCTDVGVCDEVGACCLDDGTCQDVSSAACDELNGQWLMGDECDATTVTGAPQSTGLNTFEIGNWTGSGITLYDNGNETPIAWVDYIQWMSVNEPNTAFNTYYFQTLFPASQTAPNWLCAGNAGNRLQQVFQVHLGNDIADSSLQGTVIRTSQP